MKSEILTFTMFEFGTFRLDGGAMFGSVPRTLWSKRIEPDADNRIPLTTRSLLIKTKDRLFLVDAGMGELWTDKERAIFGIQNVPASDLPFSREDVTDIILTHLHFDHAGGMTYMETSGELALTYPSATVHLQMANWENALAPTVKERASYLSKVTAPLAKANLNLVSGTSDIAKGIRVHRVDGHTVGQQWLEITTADDTFFYLTDLVPTSHHVPLPYHMGYDACSTTLLGEKNAVLNRAVSEQAKVIFEHDAETAVAGIKQDERGNFVAVKVVY